MVAAAVQIRDGDETSDEVLLQYLPTRTTPYMAAEPWVYWTRFRGRRQEGSEGSVLRGLLRRVRQRRRWMRDEMGSLNARARG
jgi:hypothetical protein